MIPGRHRRLLLTLLNGCLVLFLFIRGILPAWTVISTDFPNYYTAGRIVLSGGQVDRLYDDAWFQQQIVDQGIHEQGKFSPFPPITALFCAPLGLLSPLTALRILTVGNLVALVFCVSSLSRLAHLSIGTSVAVLLLTGIGLANDVRFGQPYILVSLCMILGLHWYRLHRSVLAGIAIGLWIPVKYFPAILLVYFLVKREWRVVFAAIATAGVLSLIAVAALGWEIHRQFFLSVLGEHLSGNLTLQSPFSPVFQSFSSLFHSLFLEDAVFHPHAPLLSRGGYLVCSWLTMIVIAAVTLWAVRRSRAEEPPAIALSVLCVGALLLAPATATYHMILLWPAAGLIWKDVREKGERWVGIVFAVLYAAIGFLPYSAFLRFYDDGLLTVLSYPRLVLLTSLFLLLFQRASTLRGVEALKPALPAR